MGFKTKLDYSNNRQIKQHLETLTTLSGGTSFGITFSGLTKGPNLTTSGETENYTLIASTFSGNNITTLYTWYDPRMELGHPYLSALTPTTSAETQTVEPVFTSSTSVIIDGNLVNTAFTGVTFDLTNIIMVDLGGGNYAGTVEHTFFDVLSANTAEYTGRTIWVDTSGITRTERLIITDTPSIGDVFTCIDSEGMGAWQPPAPSGLSADTYWISGSTGNYSLKAKNDSGLDATGDYALAEGSQTQAIGDYAHAEGRQSIASGTSSHAQGSGTTAGDLGHSEGFGSVAGGYACHAEGWLTITSGTSSHAEGRESIAGGNYSHAEGLQTQSYGVGSHSEGVDTIASDDGSHAEGTESIASGDSSHAEGFQTQANGSNSHAEGRKTIANGSQSHAGGDTTTANGFVSFVHGSNSVVNGNYSIVLGRQITGSTADTTYVDRLNIKTIGAGASIGNLGFDASGNVVTGTTGSGGTSYWSAGTGSNAIVTLNGGNIASNSFDLAEGSGTTASGFASHAEGFGSKALGQISHAEGNTTIANGFYSHSEGLQTQASGQSSHAEGQETIAGGNYSHAQGFQTRANGDYSHAEGWKSRAIGAGSHAEGGSSIFGGITGGTAIGIASHAEGAGTIASGMTSHAEGWFTQAIGDGSHAEGGLAIAYGQYSHAEGCDLSLSVTNLAYGSASHAEGGGTQAFGVYSHAQGSFTIASGDSSHASGVGSQANGYNSFVHGFNSQANANLTIVLGANITGNTADTTYVSQLNIKTVGSTAFVNDIRIDANGNLTTNTSDIRFKENINNITNALSKINQLQGVTYQWKDRDAGGDSVKLGFIAQSVEEVEPLLVFTNKNDGYKGIHIDGVIPLLVEAVKELSSGVTTSKNTYLETQTILAEDNNIELNYNGTKDSSIGGGVTILRGEEEATTMILDVDGNFISSVNIFSKGFVIPEYSPTSSQDSKGIVGNIVQDDNYIYIKRNSGWKRTPKLEDF